MLTAFTVNYDYIDFTVSQLRSSNMIT